MSMERRILRISKKTVKKEFEKWEEKEEDKDRGGNGTVWNRGDGAVCLFPGGKVCIFRWMLKILW